MNRPPFGDSLRRLNVHNKMFEVTAQNVPSKSLKVASGSFWKNGTELVEFSGSNTPDIQPPTSGAKWVVVSLSPTGIPVITNGAFSIGDPVFPTIDKSYLPLAAVYYKSTDTVITNDMVFDVRPIFSLGVAPINHSELLNRNLADSHSIAAITGLQAVLDTKVTQSEIDVLATSVNNSLGNKADVDGTSATEFVLNKDETGTVSTDILITVNRGQQPSVGIKWNESDNKWQYTNDGTEWHDLTVSGSVNDASTTVKGIVKLATAPANAANPIAVGDNDTRLITPSERTDIGTAATHVAVTSGDPHGTLALLTSENVPVKNASATVIGSSKLSLAPANAAEPIAVGDNDTRLITPSERTNIGTAATHVNVTSGDPHGTLALLTSENVPVKNASETVIGSSKLSTAPVSAAEPIAVGDNDDRLLTSTQKTNTLAHVGNTNGDPHGVLGLLPTTAVTSIRLTDTVTSDVYKIEVISGVLTATLIP